MACNCYKFRSISTLARWSPALLGFGCRGFGGPAWDISGCWPCSDRRISAPCLDVCKQHSSRTIQRTHIECLGRLYTKLVQLWNLTLSFNQKILPKSRHPIGKTISRNQTEPIQRNSPTTGEPFIRQLIVLVSHIPGLTVLEFLKFFETKSPPI